MKIPSRIFLFIISLIFILLLYRSYELTFHSPLPSAAFPKKDSVVRRGSIFDSMQNELAISIDSVSIGIKPEEIQNISKTALLLEPFMGLSSGDILKSIQKNQRKSFFWLKRKLNKSIAPRIKALKLSGVEIRIEPSRFYPHKNLAPGVLGFVGIDNEGLAGLEFQYNDDLTTSADSSLIGNNIHLTMNSLVQYILKKNLEEVFRKSRSKNAVGIISEVQTGKILAMASLSDTDSYKNRAVSDIYEPGSTFKIFTLASLLKYHLVNEEKRYYCPGYIRNKGFKIRCGEIHKEVSLPEIIQRSCNTGIIKAALELSPDQTFNTLSLFGFGKLTGIDLPGESEGILSDPQKWDNSLKMSIPIGHGVAVTPIQMIVAGNSIANGGRLLKPFLVERITTSDGRTILYNSPREKVHTLDKRTSLAILDYLKLVLQKGGTGEEANLNLKGIEAGGKTGTSIKSHRYGYYKNKYQSSFLGFFPLNDPTISIFILFDEPQGEYRGGVLAAPLFRKIGRQIFPIVHGGSVKEVSVLEDLNYDEPNSIHNKELKNKMPNLIGRSKKDIFRLVFKHYPGDHEVKGSGYVVWQNPLPGKPIQKPYQFQIRLGFPYK